VDEAAFLRRLRELPLHPGARGLADDVATVGPFVVTADALVEGVHFLPTDPAATVAWKLAAVNLSDLAAKGAVPEGIVLAYPLSDPDWDAGFLSGLGDALQAFACPLIGGDTVSLPPGAPRILSATAFGRDAAAPPRSGARAGDALWVTGTIGDAGAGLALAQGAEGLALARGAEGPAELLTAYRRPVPRLAEGRVLAPVVTAMCDVSDGLLIDAARIAAASGLSVAVDLAAVPLSAAYVAQAGSDRAARLAAATAGDDYQLLFALAPDIVPPVPATCVGRFAVGQRLSLHDGGDPLPLPARLGYLHGPLLPEQPLAPTPIGA
jgi:thiamine-monophosphate kinase